MAKWSRTYSHDAAMYDYLWEDSHERVHYDQHDKHWGKRTVSGIWYKRLRESKQKGIQSITVFRLISGRNYIFPIEHYHSYQSAEVLCVSLRQTFHWTLSALLCPSIPYQKYHFLIFNITIKLSQCFMQNYT